MKAYLLTNQGIRREKVAYYHSRKSTYNIKLHIRFGGINIFPKSLRPIEFFVLFCFKIQNEGNIRTFGGFLGRALYEVLQ